MRYAIMLVFAACTQSFYSTAQFIYNPLSVKQSDFKKIKALGYTKCYVFKLSGEDKFLYQEAEYGAQGLVAGFYEKGFNDNGDTINKNELIYKFDGAGRLANTTYTDKENRGDDEPSLYTYDAAGRLLMRETAQIDPPTYRYKYDGSGKLKEVSVTQRMPVYDSAGEFHGASAEVPATQYTYKYNKANRLSEEWEYTLRGEDQKTPVSINVWTYDAKGNVVKLQKLANDRSVISSTTYQYNNDGLLSASTFIDGTETTRYVYEYCKGCKQSWMQ